MMITPRARHALAAPVLLATLALAATGCLAGGKQALPPASTAVAPPASAPPPAPPTAPPPTSADAVASVPVAETLPVVEQLGIAERRSLDLLNELRAERGLTSLPPAEDLSRFARSWAAEMARSGFRHSGEAQWKALRADGRRCCWENIAWFSDGSESPTEIAERFHRMWVESPGHLANMTNPGHTEVGVGLLRTDGGWWGVHVFARS